MTDNIKTEPTDQTAPKAEERAPAPFVPEAPAVIIADTQGDKANKEVQKLVLPTEFTELYPDMEAHATLVVNPLDLTIPNEQKIVVYQEYKFGDEYYSNVWFKGAAVPMLDAINKGHIVYQIAVVQQTGDNSSRGRAFFVTDPVYLNTTDIQLALDAMKESIMNDHHGLRVQVQAAMKAAINKARVDARLNRDVEMPWFVCHASTGMKVKSFIKHPLKSLFGKKKK